MAWKIEALKAKIRGKSSFLLVWYYSYLILYKCTYHNCIVKLFDFNPIYIFNLVLRLFFAIIFGLSIILASVFLFVCQHWSHFIFLIHLKLLRKIVPTLFRFFFSFLYRCLDFPLVVILQAPFYFFIYNSCDHSLLRPVADQIPLVNGQCTNTRNLNKLR